MESCHSNPIDGKEDAPVEALQEEEKEEFKTGMQEKEEDKEPKIEDEKGSDKEASSDDDFGDFDVFLNGSETFENPNLHPIWMSFGDVNATVFDVTSYENKIMQICNRYLPMKKQYCRQWRNYIGLAQEELTKGNYGYAIARYKDFLSFVDNFAVSKNKSDFSTGRVIELKTLANERVSLCYLLKDSPRVALRYAQRAIILKPVVSQSHLWRAIAYRRLGDIAAALRSITMFGTLTSVSLEDCPYQYEEQTMIGMYWRTILVMIHQLRTDLKLLYFPSFNISHFPSKEQAEKMSTTFLMNNPTFNCMIHADAYSIHLLPAGSGSFLESLQEQKVAFGFKQNLEDSHYFAFLPDLKYFGFNPDNKVYGKYGSKAAKKLWDTSAYINSTSCQMSLKPGKGLFEHLLYCHALLNDEEYQKIIPEYESILADLAIFPVLSDEEWTDDLALVVDANIEMIENAIEALKEHNERELEVTREIEHIKQWLEFYERKFRVRQRQLEEAEWLVSPPSCYRNSVSPKKKFLSLHKFLDETKTKRNLFPKE